MTPAQTLTHRVKGRWHANEGIARCPCHDDRTPSLSIADGQDGNLLLYCHAGCSFRNIVNAFRSQGQLEDRGRYRPTSAARSVNHQGSPWRTGRGTVLPQPDSNKLAKMKRALELWRESGKLLGTEGWDYFVRERGLAIGQLGDLSHVLRWHRLERAIIALMTDPISNAPTGVHRTYLNIDGTKSEHKMLGRMGIVRLTPDEDVALGLGITEGIEKGVSLLLRPWAPIWVTCGAAGMASFPLLVGIEALTIFADLGTAGIKAATECADRWRADSREVDIKFPPMRSDVG